MLNIDYILQKEADFDKNVVITKFVELIDDVLAQFRADGFADAIVGIAKCVPDEAKLGLIDGAIIGKCKLLKVSRYLTEKQFDDYIPRILAGLSINEQFYILAHMNLVLVNPKIYEPNPVFANLVYSIIKQTLI